MNFNLKNTAAYRAVKIGRIPFFRFSRFLYNLFLYLFVFSLFLIPAAFFGFVLSFLAIKTIVLFLVLFLLFWEASLFLELKIKELETKIPLSNVILDVDNYNLADFLNMELAEIIEEALKFCKKRKISEVNSTALFYGVLKISKGMRVLFFRLGIDIARLQEDLKNYLEKQQKQDRFGKSFSQDFEEAIKEALAVSNERKRKRIGEKEALIALARKNEFFKKVLLDHDLKQQDIEDITMWLDYTEQVLKSSKKFWTYENLSKQGSLGKDWVSGYTVTLDQFSIDWRSVVKNWTFREIVGHEKEIKETEIVLARSSLSNVLLVGHPGVGRKSIVEAIAQKCFLSRTLPELNNKRVVELDMVSLFSRIQDPEELEATLDNIFQESMTAGNVILVIENLQNFVGQALQKPGTADISGILSKYLAIPSFRFIGITSYDGFHKNIEQNSSFADFFRKIEVSEISEAETIKILQNSALEFEQKYKILILYPAIREIVNLTARYFPSMPFPKKAIDILSEVVVYVQTIKEKVVLPHHIAKIISDRTEIPVGKMEFKEKEVLLNLENLIHQRIINQEEAVKEISVAMRRARAGIASKKRPIGTFLFLGPTGVGKTETSKALAQIYFGPASAPPGQGFGEAKEEKMHRIDMSEFQAISDIPRLIGAVSPVEMQGLLTTPARETPFSLVLLDEIEKAHPNILNLFLQVLDEGHITDGQGRKVVFTNTIIICTSNAGSGYIFEAVNSGGKIIKEKLLDILFKENTFRPEFINRFDAVVIFNPLTKDNLLDIAQLMLASLKKNLKEKEIDFEITEPLKEKIVGLSYKPAYGAREMRRVIQDKVENIVAEALISDNIKKGDKIEIDPENFKLIINPINN
ncbi:MAG: ATPase AAA-2 domain protein [Parcubacteria group bacterium Licking1014_1]|nr:MAG: ATPase AAA-2 domain protein [Parcubacteria group bacterium Licking1014_1]